MIAQKEQGEAGIRSWVQSSAPNKPRMVALAGAPSTWEEETEELEVQDHLQLHSELKGMLDYPSPYLST